MKRIPSFTATKRSEVKLSELKRSKSNWSRYYTAQTDKLQVITIIYKKGIDKTRKKKKRRANKDTYDHCARSGTNRRIENDVKAIDKGIWIVRTIDANDEIKGKRAGTSVLNWQKLYKKKSNRILMTVVHAEQKD